MRRDIIDLFACPICKGDLVIDFISKEDGDEIIEGGLCCSKCKEHYPIENGVVILLPPDTR
ncbi:MAG: Trm112p-like protein [Candidatus Methanolliviera sp. GoM_asphalt]|nr:MAG: Trm112p-like protein [Candidatus Methanolliviera sp. GoM_asphalt]